MRMDPPPSVPRPSGPRPAATAAAAPPLEPPGVSARFQGLRVIPNSGLSVTALWPNSDVVVLPVMTAPAARRRATATASSSGTTSANRREPPVVRRPRVKMTSLMETGTPWSDPSGSRLTTAISASRAARRAVSWARRQTAFRRGLSASIRASTASVISTGETCLDRTRSTSSSAGRQIISWGFITRRSAPGSCCTPEHCITRSVDVGHAARLLSRLDDELAGAVGPATAAHLRRVRGSPAGPGDLVVEPHGTVVGYAPPPGGPRRRALELDRHGTPLCALRWSADTLAAAWVRIADRSWLRVEPRAATDAPWGLSDRVWHAERVGAAGTPLAVYETLDYAGIDRIPTPAEPGRLPPGGGSAVLNLIAALAADQARAGIAYRGPYPTRSEEHTSELQSLAYLVCRLLLEKKKQS